MSKMANYKHYTYRVIWSQEDEEYVALCAEMPSLSFLADNHTDALNGLMHLVATIIDDMQKNNESIPEPIASKHYSGKFMVRVSPERHRAIAIHAAELGISINRYISDKVAY